MLFAKICKLEATGIHERQPHKLARPIDWLATYVKKYYLLCTRKVLLKNYEPFLRNITS